MISDVANFVWTAPFDTWLAGVGVLLFLVLLLLFGMAVDRANRERESLRELQKLRPTPGHWEGDEWVRGEAPSPVPGHHWDFEVKQWVRDGDRRKK